jgi:hypothetical protein
MKGSGPMLEPHILTKPLGFKPFSREYEKGRTAGNFLK